METWLEVILHFAGGAARDVPLDFPRAGKMFGEVLERCNYSKAAAGRAAPNPTPIPDSCTTGAARATEGSLLGWEHVPPCPRGAPVSPRHPTARGAIPKQQFQGSAGFWISISPFSQRFPPPGAKVRACACIYPFTATSSPAAPEGGVPLSPHAHLAAGPAATPRAPEPRFPRGYGGQAQPRRVPPSPPSLPLPAPPARPGPPGPPGLRVKGAMCGSPPSPAQLSPARGDAGSELLRALP